MSKYTQLKSLNSSVKSMEITVVYTHENPKTLRMFEQVPTVPAQRSVFT